LSEKVTCIDLREITFSLHQAQQRLLSWEGMQTAGLNGNMLTVAL
jgi:hypothetical protein